MPARAAAAQISSVRTIRWHCDHWRNAPRAACRSDYGCNLG
jgi:hypothetical protein